MNAEPPDWKLVVHGGSGAIERGTLTTEQDRRRARRPRTRAGRGRGDPAGGGSALDAVEAAARVLEDDPAFNAGRGSVFTYEGRNELDAAIMDGSTRGAGAVTGVRRPGIRSASPGR